MLKAFLNYKNDLNILIGFIRFLLYSCITIGLLIGLNYGNQYKNDYPYITSNISESWTKTDYNEIYARNFTQTWTTRLGQQWTNVNIENVYNKTKIQNLNFTSSIFFTIVPDGLLRLFTLNIINRKILNLKITSNLPMTYEDGILTFQSANVGGIILFNNSYYDIMLNENIPTATVNLYISTFFTLYIVLGIMILTYSIYLGIVILISEYKEYNKQVSNLIKTNLISFCDHVYEIDENDLNETFMRKNI